jgi:23S rRNA (adenine2503-C2)-methyltransferase
MRRVLLPSVNKEKMDHNRANIRHSLLADFLENEAFFFDTLYNALSARTGGMEKYRGGQIVRRLYSGAAAFDELTELPKALRESLSALYTLRETAVSTRLTAEDGTVKLQIRLSDGAFVEAVLLTDGDGRRTACISTQAGCPAGCVFCKTGDIGFLRNLRAAEIVEQFFHLRAAALGTTGAGGGANTISNIVVMGMGEPLLNLAELQKALVFLEKTGDDGRFSLRRITVSTSGIVEGIRALPDKLHGVRLALSVTTADEELRRRLMPIAKTNPLPALHEALSYYQSREKKRITLETVLLGGINTREKDAAALASFAEGLEVIVNIIPWNPVAGLLFDATALREPAGGEAERFAAMLHRHGLKTELRRRKGRSVCGACGQLGGGGSSERFQPRSPKSLPHD